jgi:choline-sulfatase
MIRHGRFKYIHYCGYEPMLFDLQSDPHERNDLASDPSFKHVLADADARLRAILDPDATDRLAKADQTKMIDALGGKEAVLGRGAVRISPPPGVATTRIPAERS